MSDFFVGRCGFVDPGTTRSSQVGRRHRRGAAALNLLRGLRRAALGLRPTRQPRRHAHGGASAALECRAHAAADALGQGDRAPFRFSAILVASRRRARDVSRTAAAERVHFGHRRTGFDEHGDKIEAHGACAVDGGCQQDPFSSAGRTRAGRAHAKMADWSEGHRAILAARRPDVTRHGLRSLGLRGRRQS
jgi:hypothetical protein